jgi:hypothetical protein
MAMHSSFSNIKDNKLSKRFGGHTLGVADPYVTGYHFVWFDKIPTQINTTDEPCGALTDTDIKDVLAGTCLSVTPPGGTLNKIEFTGLGGVKWSVPGNLDYGNTVSIKFLEMQTLPVSSIMHRWVKLIRDYRTGVANIDEDGSNEYSKRNYSALMYYWTTAPDGKTIEYAACYDGMFPSKDPADLLTSDVETIGKLEVEIEFNVDYAWHEKWVYQKCSDFASNFTSAMGENGTIANYGKKF